MRTEQSTTDTEPANSVVFNCDRCWNRIYLPADASFDERECTKCGGRYQRELVLVRRNQKRSSKRSRRFGKLTLVLLVLIVAAVIWGPRVFKQIRTDWENEQRWTAIQNQPSQLLAYARNGGEREEEAWLRLIELREWEVIGEALGSRFPQVKTIAKRRLLELAQTREGIKEIGNLLIKSPNPWFILEALDDAGSEIAELVPALETLVRSTRVDAVKGRALHLLIAIESKDAIASYGKLLRAKEHQLPALRELANRRPPPLALLPDLLAISQRARDGDRKFIVPLLEAYGKDKRIVTRLKEFLRDDSLIVRLDARDALVRLTGASPASLSILRNPVKARRHVVVVLMDHDFGPGGHGYAVNEVVRSRFNGEIITIEMTGLRSMVALMLEVKMRPTSRIVVNMSYGTAYDSLSESIVGELINEGVLLVAAAGNDNKMRCSFPSAYSGVIAVGAAVLNANGNAQKASYSNYGDCITFYSVDDALSDLERLQVDEKQLRAEVEQIQSEMHQTFKRDEYAAKLVELLDRSEQLKRLNERVDIEQLRAMGTSFTAPKVTATLAELLRLNPELGSFDLQQILFETSRGGVAGRALIDERKALALALRMIH